MLRFLQYEDKEDEGMDEELSVELEAMGQGQVS